MGITPPSAGATPHQVAPAFPYVFRQDRRGRKGQRCRQIKRGTVTVCIEFENDGTRWVVPIRAIRRSPEFKFSSEVVKSTNPSAMPLTKG